MLFHYKIDEENISSQLGPPCVVCMVSPYLCGFSLDVMASSHISTMCMLGELMCWNSSRLHECEYGEWPCMERQPVLAGSHLEPWAARRGSGHPKPWSRISRLEENSLILLIFLKCIKITFILMLNTKRLLGLYLEVRWCFCHQKYVVGNWLLVISVNLWQNWFHIYYFASSCSFQKPIKDFKWGLTVPKYLSAIY